MRSLIISLVCFFYCTIITFTQDNITTWTGNVSSEWDNSDNWTDGVPNSILNSHAVIPAEPEGERFPVIDEAASGSAAIVSQFGNLQINGALNCTSFNGYNNSSTNLSNANFTCHNLKLQEGSSMVMENDSNVEAENFVLENDSHVLVKDVSKFSHDNTQIDESCSVVIEGWDRSLTGGNLKVNGVLTLLAGTFFADKGVETGINSTVTISGDNTVFVFSGDTDEEDFNCDGTVNVDGGILVADNGRKFKGSPSSTIVVTGGYFSILDLILKGSFEVDGGDVYLQNTEVDPGSTVSVKNGTLNIFGTLEVKQSGTLDLSGGETNLLGGDDNSFVNNGTTNISGGQLNSIVDFQNNGKFSQTSGKSNFENAVNDDTVDVFGGEFRATNVTNTGSFRAVLPDTLACNIFGNTGKFVQEGGSVNIQDHLINDDTVTLKIGDLKTNNLTNNAKLNRSDTHTLNVTGSFTNNGEVEYSSSKEVNTGGTTSFSLDENPYIDFTPIEGSLGETTVVFNYGSTCPENAFGSGCPAAPFSIKRFYDIKPSQKKKATLKLYYLEGELNGQIHGSSMKLFNYDSVNGVWRNAGYYDSTSGTWVNATLTSFGGSGTEEDPYFAEYTDVGSYSPFVLSSEDSPLPVELISFTAELIGNEVLLEWETATEVNNFGFDVERRTSSIAEWDKLGFVQGHGTTNSPKSYSFIDDLTLNLTLNPNLNRIDYRLKQIDNDGTFAYSKIVTVDITNITSVDDEINYKFALEQNYPNPFNPTTTIKFTIPSVVDENFRPLQTKLIVYDILGREVAILVNRELQSGNHVVEFDASNLSSGMYFYRIDVGGKNISTKKMILLR